MVKLGESSLKQMSELRLEDWTLPAANLGPENPLPTLPKAADLHAAVKVDDTVPPEDREHLGWGQPSGILPYRMQDGYDRNRKPRAFKAVVLENEYLRAAFFPELGGRLWSLVHKPTGRELLARNPVFQPCNLAIRNAWISGGVEWNIGWTGHWPMTCSPLFAARYTLPDGTPALRLWEWERLRRIPFQIDAWLPAGSPVLLVRVSIHNPHDAVLPIYWWSNIAVPQTADTRVLVSADDALVHNNETNALSRVDLPYAGTEELTYPGRLRGSRDCFFRVPPDVQPWITALDSDGLGLFQTSSSRLRGRKLFRWGIQPGGQNWQRFLGTPDYIEIQAGLARTQTHHLPMPPKATWSWVEAYGLLQVDPATVHCADWSQARQAAEQAVESVIGSEDLEAELAASATWAQTPAHDIIHKGSGWGALEMARRTADEEPAVSLGGVFYPANSMGEEQEAWKTLLERGILPESDPLDEPGSFVPAADWLTRLEKSLHQPGGRHWRSLFHLGVLYWQAQRNNQAMQAWEQSCEARENPWARRCLGVAHMLERRYAEAIPHLRQALEMKPDLRPLLIEYLQALLADGQHAVALKLIAALPAERRADGRIRLLEGRALLAAGDLDGVERLLNENPIPHDMREGEAGPTGLWFELQAHRLARSQGRQVDDELRAQAQRTFAVPVSIDYRMGG